MTKTKTLLVFRHPEAVPFTLTRHQSLLLTKPQLAQRLRVAERTIDRYVAKRRIPYLKLPSRVLFDWDHVVAHLAINARRIVQNEPQWSTIVQNGSQLIKMVHD